MAIDVKSRRLPEGHEMKFGSYRRKGSICLEHGELHTIYELIGEHNCGCNGANIVVPEPEGE